MLSVFIPSLGTEEELGEQALSEFIVRTLIKYVVIRCSLVGWDRLRR